MDFPFQVFLCMLFGVVCVVFIVWVFRQDGGFITTEYTVPQLDTDSMPPVQYAQTAAQPGAIEFTNMRLLVYYSRIAVLSACGLTAPNEENFADIHDRAVEKVLDFCKVDGLELTSDVRDAIPSVVDYAISEHRTPLF